MNEYAYTNDGNVRVDDMNELIGENDSTDYVNELVIDTNHLVC